MNQTETIPEPYTPPFREWVHHFLGWDWVEPSAQPPVELDEATIAAWAAWVREGEENQ